MQPPFSTLQGQNLGLITECKCFTNHAGEDGSIWSVVLISKILNPPIHPTSVCYVPASSKYERDWNLTPSGSMVGEPGAWIQAPSPPSMEGGKSEHSVLRRNL